MSFADNQFNINAFVQKYTALGAKKWRHVVAVFFDKKKDFHSLVIRNDKNAPENYETVDDRIAEISVKKLPFVNLKKYESVIAFPEISCLRPEISASSPNFFSIYDYIPDKQRQYLFETRRDLIKQLPDILKASFFMDEKDIELLFHLHLKTLKLTNFLYHLSIDGLIVVQPGKDIDNCIKDAKLYYLSKITNTIADQKKSVIIHKIEELKKALIDQTNVYVPAPLLPFLPIKGPALDIEVLLTGAGKHREWKENTYPRIASLINNTTTNNHAAMPYKQIQQFIDISRNKALGPLQRLDGLEKAYIIARQSSPEIWSQIGYEQHLYFLYKELITYVKQLNITQLSDYCNMLKTYYLPVNTEDTVDSDRVMLDSIIKKLRHSLVAFKSFSSESDEYKRCKNYEKLFEYIEYLSLQLISKKMNIKFRNQSGYRFLFHADNRFVFDQFNNPDGFLMNNLWQVILTLGDIFLLSEIIKNKGGSERIELLKKMAEQIDFFPKWQLFPKRQLVLRHEETFILPLRNLMKAYLYSQSEELKDHVSIECELTTHDIILDKDNKSSIDVKVKNIGNINANSFTLELIDSHNFNIPEAESKVTRNNFPPGRFFDTRFCLSFTNEFFELFEYSRKLNIKFAISWIPQSPKKDPSLKIEKKKEQIEKSLDVQKVTDTPPPTSFPNKSPVGVHINNYYKFHGRHKQIKEIFQSFMGETPYLIVGPLRSGKSSFAKMIKMCIENKEAREYFNIPTNTAELKAFVPVWISLQSLNDGFDMESDFYKLLMRTLKKKLVKLIDIDKQPDTETLYSTQFQDQLKTIINNLPKPYKKIAFFIDEFNKFSQLPENKQKSIYDRFRVIVCGDDNVRWMIISVTGLQKVAYKAGSPLFNIFTSIKIKNLEHEEYDSFIKSQLKGVSIYSEAIREIFDESGGHPFVTNLILDSLITVLIAKKTSIVKKETIQEAVRKFLQKNIDQLLFPWAESNPLTRQLLIVMCSEKHPSFTQKYLLKIMKDKYRINVPKIDMDNALNTLETQGILIEMYNKWSFNIPVIKKWIQRNYIYDDPYVIIQELEEDRHV